MTVANYQLSKAQLLEQANIATAIMRSISKRVHNLNEDEKHEEDGPLTDLHLELANKEQQPKELYQADFVEVKNPGKPHTKKRTLR